MGQLGLPQWWAEWAGALGSDSGWLDPARWGSSISCARQSRARSARPIKAHGAKLSSAEAECHAERGGGVGAGNWGPVAKAGARGA